MKSLRQYIVEQSDNSQSCIQEIASNEALQDIVESILFSHEPQKETLIQLMTAVSGDTSGYLNSSKYSSLWKYETSGLHVRFSDWVWLCSKLSGKSQMEETDKLCKLVKFEDQAEYIWELLIKADEKTLKKIRNILIKKSKELLKT